MNIPNTLTVMRIIMSLFIPYFLITDNGGYRLIACLLFTVAAFTDLFDGKIARKYNLITNLGKILDPIADKLLVLGTFFTLSYMGIVSNWIVIPIAIRELGITVWRFYHLKKGKALAAEKAGKMKTASQITAISFSYFYFMSITYLNAPVYLNWILFGLMYIWLAVAVYLTVYSGVKYILVNNK